MSGVYTRHNTGAVDAGAEVAVRWLEDFRNGLNQGVPEVLVDLFEAEFVWRDVVAFGRDFRSVTTVEGLKDLVASFGSVRCEGVHDVEPFPNDASTALGLGTADWRFRFSTDVVEGIGVLRLRPDTSGRWRALGLLTAADHLKDHPERVGSNRPLGAPFLRDFTQRAWRSPEERVADRKEGGAQVLVVGGGQAGLAVAARLEALDVRTLVVESSPRIGDNWRERYDALVLHNEVWANHLPYMPFPDSWPVFTPKDKMANWLEAYVDSLDLAVQTSTTFVGARYVEAKRCWVIDLARRDGGKETLEVPHLVMATGVSGIPRVPTLPGLEDFRGVTMHSAEFVSAESLAGRRVAVFGTGNSGHDLAQDLHSHGADVTMIQRGPTTVLSLDPGALKYYSLYREGRSTEDADLQNLALAPPLADRLARRLTAQVTRMDDDLLAGLRRIGFKTGNHLDPAGFQTKFLTDGGGYYINIGCSDLLIDGEIGLRHYDDIRRLVPDGLEFTDGRVLELDAVLLATGYEPMEVGLRRWLGDEVADRVGPVWGLDMEGEIRGVARPTGHPGLWVSAGGLFQVRILSKFLALQIQRDLLERGWPGSRSSSATGAGAS